MTALSWQPAWDDMQRVLPEEPAQDASVRPPLDWEPDDDEEELEPPDHGEPWFEEG
jgi:hypothetical protein